MAKKTTKAAPATKSPAALCDEIFALQDKIGEDTDKAVLRGNKTAATRARVNLSKLRDLCSEARKSLLPYIARRG